ncbi:MAG TPA: hypothetical protein ENF64_01995 [Hadesarchaea archaeon]|nr:hypothetical protein [Hadesarchaea archaeon]
MEIGRSLMKSYRITLMKQRVLGKCPKCGGDLRVTISRITHKRFAGCSNYPKCTNSFPLPQDGTIVPLGSICKECGTPMIQVNRAGRRPYKMCLNPNCRTKSDWRRDVVDTRKK